MDNLENRFDNQSVYLIAEIGGNHEGSFDLARKQLDLAIESGADCIKFQLYTGDSLVNPLIAPDRHQHFRKFELSRDQHIALAQHCIDAKRDYLASVWDLEMLEWIDPFLKHYKIGSGDLTAVPFLRAFAERGKPMIISTGLSDISEVMAAVATVRQHNSVYNQPGMLALLQCTSMYPIAYSDANLAVIQNYCSISNVVVGYSDHTVGEKALLYSVAAGARILEFHFTDQREGRVFRDHKVSLTADEVKKLRAEVDEILKLLGSSEKRPLDIEVENGHLKSFRRGLYLACEMKPGDIVKKEDIRCLRPCEGIPATDFDRLVGSKVKQTILPLQSLDWSMFETR